MKSEVVGGKYNGDKVVITDGKKSSRYGWQRILDEV
jgi:hypothetical protein